MTSPHHSKPVRLASTALHLAMSREYDRAAYYVQRISDECGGEGLGTALVSWCDTFADHATGGLTDKMIVCRANAMEMSTGRMSDPRTDESVPDSVAWTAAMIQARANLDMDWWDDLLGQLPDDPHQRGEYVLRLLHVVADTMNGLPRGYARMGQVT